MDSETVELRVDNAEKYCNILSEIVQKDEISEDDIRNIRFVVGWLSANLERHRDDQKDKESENFYEEFNKHVVDSHEFSRF